MNSHCIQHKVLKTTKSLTLFGRLQSWESESARTLVVSGWWAVSSTYENRISVGISSNFTPISSQRSVKHCVSRMFMKPRNVSEVMGEVMQAFSRNKHEMAGSVYQLTGYRLPGARWMLVKNESIHTYIHIAAPDPVNSVLQLNSHTFAMKRRELILDYEQRIQRTIISKIWMYVG